MTIGLTTDSGRGLRNTVGFTAGINTGALVVVIFGIVYFLQTGDVSVFGRLQPAFSR